MKPHGTNFMLSARLSACDSASSCRKFYVVAAVHQVAEQLSELDSPVSYGGLRDMKSSK